LEITESSATALPIPTKMKLSIIIVNWNSLGYLRKCLTSIYEHVRDLPFEVIVVDNASPEPGIEFLKADFPGVLVIKSNINLGFAGANNLGFSRSSGEYVLFLNPDTEITDNAFKTMLDQAGSVPDPGVIGCKLLNSDLTVQTSCIQTFPTIPNQLFDYEYFRLRWPSSSLWGIGALFSASETPVPVEVISGACMLLRRDVFERAGIFTEDYFMYAEDLDLCYKVKALGFRNYYVGKAQVIHHGGRSSNLVNVSNWSIIMRFKAVHKFCVKRQGSLYGSLFRATMGAAALLRVVVLSLAKPFAGNDLRKQSIRNSTSKWLAVLKWSYGVDGAVLKTSTQR
jgi:N-acetylglucosaminyl-diphospho-decaprenol L-rhamnosyltransferase